MSALRYSAYMEQSNLRRRALDALPTIYRPEKGIYHYRSMAKTNYRGYLRRPVVKVKKYFYVMRPLLAARWIDRTQRAAPIEFDKLLEMLDGEREVLCAVQVLLDKKRAAAELGLVDAVPVLNSFIETALDGALPEVPKKPLSPEVVSLLNELFHEALLTHGANNSLERSRDI